MERPHSVIARCYTVLEVQSPSDLHTIKKAHRRLALRYHPDKARSGDRERHAARFRDIQEAYEVLVSHVREQCDKGSRPKERPRAPAPEPYYPPPSVYDAVFESERDSILERCEEHERAVALERAKLVSLTDQHARFSHKVHGLLSSGTARERASCHQLESIKMKISNAACKLEQFESMLAYARLYAGRPENSPDLFMLDEASLGYITSLTTWLRHHLFDLDRLADGALKAHDQDKPRLLKDLQRGMARLSEDDTV